MSYFSELLDAAKNAASFWASGDARLLCAMTELGVCSRQAGGIDRSVQEAIEEQWLSRAKSQDFGKPSTVTYKRKEIEFFMGAAAALNAMLPVSGKDQLGPLVPMSWMVSIMTGRNIVEPERIRYTK